MREARFDIDFHLESDAEQQCLSDTAVSDWCDSIIWGTYLHRYIESK